jgi:type IV pilus assembly protein PilQ
MTQPPHSNVPQFTCSGRLLLCLAICSIGACGCLGMNKITRKTVADLYNEALRDADARPNAIQPNFSIGRSSSASSNDILAKASWPPAREASAIGDTSAPQIPSPHFSQEQEFHFGPWSNLLQQPSDSVILATAYSPIPLNSVRAAVSQAVEKGGINEVFDQTDVREAIQVLATSSNQTVVIDETVGGVTSAQIQNASFEVALTKVLEPLGLYFARHEDAYYVAPPDPDSPLFSKISKRFQYSPLHHEVKGLLLLLPPRHKKYLNNSEGRNLILVDAPPAIGDEIMTRLKEMDTPVAQIELEAIVCVVSPDSGFRFGLDWNHVVGINGVDSLKAGMTGLSFSGSASPNGARSAFSDFAVTSAFVRLLAQEGYITIRAAPRVTTKDGEKASIAINRETFFSLQGSAANAFFSPTIQKVEAGISLDITPRLHGDMISVHISKAEVSEDIRSSDAVLTSNPYPIINRRTVSTNVNVPEGHTIVIGGLVQRQTVERVNRIPILSRIPLAGRLFQTIEKQEQDAEVAIFISPKLVVDNYAYRE